MLSGRFSVMPFITFWSLSKLDGLFLLIVSKAIGREVVVLRSQVGMVVVVVVMFIFFLR